MPLIYLRHPIHGEKVEHNETLASMDKGNGWVEFDPSVKPESVAVEAPAITEMPDFLKGAVPSAPESKLKSKSVKPKPEG